LFPKFKDKTQSLLFNWLLLEWKRDLDKDFLPLNFLLVAIVPFALSTRRTACDV
jgi:hypothetical protein